MILGSEVVYKEEYFDPLNGSFQALFEARW